MIRRDEAVLGDVIIGIDDKNVKNYDDLYNSLEGKNVGDTVVVKFLRKGKKREVSLKLFDLSENVKR